MLEDSSFWALVGLVLFLALVAYLGVPKLVSKSLDERAERIRRELDEARELKEEAKQQLAEYQRRRREAEAEARDIVAGAERDAQAIVEEARAKSAEYITRRTRTAELKIAQAESDAIAEVRAAAVNLAIQAAAGVISDRNLGADTGTTERSIEEVRRRLN
ncbi:ATP F0F1 synthase subunit B [Aureimonas populi]|uniref:ATP synthase subunit b n=1 Tax=Aureimonas populi TaxID=1701758 RepID=A0ABW5CM99_9HYPH|nr:ATP F0F1 synthase subunit B [Aureimonas populi]